MQRIQALRSIAEEQAQQLQALRQKMGHAEQDRAQERRALETAQRARNDTAEVPLLLPREL